MNRFKTLLAFLIYFMVPFLITIPFEILKIDLDQVPYVIKTIYSLLGELVIALSIILIFIKELEIKFKDLKKNHEAYFNKYLKYWFIMLGLMAISNIIIGLFNSAGATNQNVIEELFVRNPIYIFMSAVIFAPIVEELLFRLSLRNVIKNDLVFMIMSGLLFGLIHIISAENIMSELIYLIPYSIPGFVFAYVLIKSKNIFVPIGIHFLHNGFLIAIQFLMLVLK